MTGLYRLFLRLYPRWFRARYEDELVEAFRPDRADPRHAGIRGALAFWACIVADTAVSAARARRLSRPSPPPHSPRRSTMDAIRQDLRHAFRQLVHRPGFTAVAVLSLAVGIGGNALILAIVDGFVLHPFPIPNADRVVVVGSTMTRMSSEEHFVEAISVPEYLDIRRAASLQSLAVFDLGNRNISGGDRPERVFTALAVTDLFAPFGLAPAFGRGFTPAELAPGGPAVAIISHRLWQGRFGGDPALVGRTVRVNGTSCTVVGIMPPQVLVVGTDLWIPLGASLETMPRQARQFTIVGRLAPGATLTQANAELSAIAAQTVAIHGATLEEYRGWRLSAVPWAEALTRDMRAGAQLLLGAVALVLLIACVNLSNLSLARSTTRQRELAVRLALGAGRRAIVRHVVVEVTILAAAGGAAGLVLAYLGLPAVVSLVPPEAGMLGMSASINGRVLAWTAAFTTASAVLVALIPALQSTHASPQEALKSDARTASAAPGPRRLRHVLIVVEVALAVVLLVGAGLLVRSFANLRSLDPGFEPTGVLTMRLTLPTDTYKGARVNDFFQQVVDRLEAAPGVRAASAATQFPPEGWFRTAFRIEGTAASADNMPMTMITAASAGHFRTLGVPVLEGRAFDARDRGDAPRVAIVNQAFAAQFLPGLPPLGRRVLIGDARPPAALEIVGVVRNTQNRDMRNAPAPELFVPLHQQRLNNQLFLLIRGDGEASALLPLVRQQIAAVDPDQPIYAVRPLDDVLAAATFGNRFSMLLFATFAVVAAALAAIGIYGVMSYAVGARTQEIGVRLAIGAGRVQVIWMVLRQVLTLTALGLATGTAIALAASAAIRTSLFRVNAVDPPTLAGVSVVMGAVALVAGWLPAWRASRIDPVRALRYE